MAQVTYLHHATPSHQYLCSFLYAPSVTYLQLSPDLRDTHTNNNIGVNNYIGSFASQLPEPPFWHAWILPAVPFPLSSFGALEDTW